MILVTGGTGLVGSYLLHRLIKNNRPVRALKRATSSTEKTKKVFELLSENGADLFNKIEWIDADITDIPALTLAFKGIKKVYHCAALVSFNNNDDNLLIEHNIVGTANIVNLCLANAVKKLVHVSSVATLGEQHHPITEKTYWNPEEHHHMYAITKYGAELEVWRGTQEGLNAIIVNPGVILGEVFYDRGSGLLFKKINNNFPYYTEGTMGFIHVKDVARSMIGLMDSDITNEQFILVSENYSYKRLFKEIQHALQIQKKLKLATPLMLQLAYLLDCIKGFFTGKRSLPKALIEASNKKLAYENHKIKNALDFEFMPISEAIQQISKDFKTN